MTEARHAIDFCCDEFASAVEVTFAVPVHGPTGWLLYGTDAETASAGLPELRYWAARFCPFCGAALRPYPGRLPRGRAFGFGPDAATDEAARGSEPESGRIGGGEGAQEAPRAVRQWV
jgi:hypothetical protein